MKRLMILKHGLVYYQDYFSAKQRIGGKVSCSQSFVPSLGWAGFHLFIHIWASLYPCAEHFKSPPWLAPSCPSDDHIDSPSPAASLIPCGLRAVYTVMQFPGALSLDLFPQYHGSLLIHFSLLTNFKLHKAKNHISSTKDCIFILLLKKH